jgi:hypothetical protein
MLQAVLEALDRAAGHAAQASSGPVGTMPVGFNALME